MYFREQTNQAHVKLNNKQSAWWSWYPLLFNGIYIYSQTILGYVRIKFILLEWIVCSNCVEYFKTFNTSGVLCDVLFIWIYLKPQDFVYNEADSSSINEVLTKAKRQSLMLISISTEGDSWN